MQMLRRSRARGKCPKVCRPARHVERFAWRGLLVLAFASSLDYSMACAVAERRVSSAAHNLLASADEADYFVVRRASKEGDQQRAGSVSAAALPSHQAFAPVRRSCSMSAAPATAARLQQACGITAADFALDA